MGPRRQEEQLKAVFHRGQGRRQTASWNSEGKHEGQAAAVPPGGQREKDASWRGCLSHTESFHGGRRERPVSRVARGDGFLSVCAEGTEVSLWGR